MHDDVKTVAREVLTKHLEANNCRKTAERYAILDTAYDMKGNFTIDELFVSLAKQSFHVSRATVYNTMRLLIELRLVIRHCLNGIVKYEACYGAQSRCFQICTVCGKIVEADIPELSDTLQNLRMRRFRKECCSVYMYGVCSKCQNRMSRSKGCK